MLFRPTRQPALHAQSMMAGRAWIRAWSTSHHSHIRGKVNSGPLGPAASSCQRMSLHISHCQQVFHCTRKHRWLLAPPLSPVPLGSTPPTERPATQGWEEGRKGQWEKGCCHKSPHQCPRKSNPLGSITYTKVLPKVCGKVGFTNNFTWVQTYTYIF